MEAEQQGGEVARVRAAVRAGGLLAGEQPLIVLLSGGRDSTCLLDVALALRGSGALSTLHVNYGLREQAAADERHCTALCEGLGVPLRLVHAERPPAAACAPDGVEAGAGNVQAWARDLRYRAAAELARESGALIASGHTATDQVETILYRLAASPGRRALLGMAASDLTEQGARLVRPLLGVTREQTAAYCRELGLRWVEDASNESPEYARARVRHGLVPALRAVHPAAEENVLRTARLLRAEAEVLEELVAAELAGGEQIALARLEALPPALARLVVVRLAERAAGTYVPQAGGRVAELLALGRRGGRAELHVGGGAGAVVEDGRLHMVKLAPRDGEGSEAQASD